MSTTGHAAMGVAKRLNQELEKSKLNRYPTSTQTVVNVVKGYEDLLEILARALDQAQNGKGSERHADNKPFADQPMQKICQMVGVGFATGQAIKKAQESTRMEPDRAIHELLGAINYLAGAILHLETQQPDPFDEV